MFPRKIRFFFFSNITVLAIGAAMALSVVAPSASMAGTAAPARSVSAAREIGNVTGAMTDISAARRRHYARRGSAAARGAFGSTIGGPVYRSPYYPVYRSPYNDSYPGFGYGIHDNSGPRSSG